MLRAVLVLLGGALFVACASSTTPGNGTDAPLGDDASTVDGPDPIDAPTDAPLRGFGEIRGQVTTGRSSAPVRPAQSCQRLTCSTAVALRFGTCPTGIRATSLSVAASTANTALSPAAAT